MSPALAAAATSVRFADVITVPGNALRPLSGWPVERLGVLACGPDSCRPIPMQVDERDAAGAWVLDRGPQPGSDSPAALLDDNDVLLFMADDCGRAADAGELPHGAVAMRVIVTDPLSSIERWAYVVGYDRPAPRAERSYVDYDAAADRFTGARVRMGFRDGVPTYLALDDGTNLLDRLKVRAAASVFWGWLRFSRSEDDLSTELVGWHAGPIRIIRHQKQRVRLGWGIRSPTFRSYTYFYRDFAELPVGLRLNFPPTYFFSDIVIEVVLDFRDLDGWRLDLPRRSERLRIGEIDGGVVADLNRADDTTFALVGDRVTLVQMFGVSASLDPVSKRFIYRDTAQPHAPEDVAGEHPGVGYALEDWEAVGAGEHGLTAVSYALPDDVDVGAFIRGRSAPLETMIEALRAQ